MSYPLFEHYSPAIHRLGAAGAQSPELVIENTGRDILRYIPFEHVNAGAKLVIVGITPGPNQLKLTYAETQRLLNDGAPIAQLLREVKKLGAFGGSAMRPNLLRYLRHFKFDKILGITDVESIWAENAALLHATSVIPHAAFKTSPQGEAMFAGSFAYVMASPLFRQCFMDCFVATLQNVGPQALYIALGDCPEDALQWCVENGHLQSRQVLGSFCHPSTSGGSAPGFYIRDKTLEDLKPNDPVRQRAVKLDRAYANMAAATARLLDTAGPAQLLPSAAATPLQSQPARSTTVKPAKEARTLPADPIAERIVARLVEGGYVLGKHSKYLAEFTAADRTIYLLKAKTRLDSICVMVHPSLNREDLVALTDDGAVSNDHKHHSSMSRFPSKMHTGSQPINYGWQVKVSTVEELESVVGAILTP